MILNTTCRSDSCVRDHTSCLQGLITVYMREMPAHFFLHKLQVIFLKKQTFHFHRPFCWLVSIFSSISPPSPSAMISCTLMVCAELLCTLRSCALRTQCLRLFSTHSCTWRASGKTSAKTLQQSSYSVNTKLVKP